jgi:hypothetical protein
MKKSIPHPRRHVLSLVAATSALFLSHAHADRIFYDSFETPYNPPGGTDPDGWYAPGHPSYFSVFNEGDGSSWSTPYGEQAIGTYSNGVATKTGAGYVGDDFGNFVPGTYSLSFNISSRSTKGEYRAELWAVNELFGGASTLLGFVEGDTDGSKDMSFSRSIVWTADEAYNGNRLEIRLRQDPLRSNWRNTPLWDNVALDFASDTDTTAPIVLDISDDKDGATVAPGTLVTYTVTFSEDMDATTVDATDFGNASSAPVTIGTVTETEPTSGVFLVPVTVGAGTGNEGLRLQINQNAVLYDAADPANAMDTSSSVQDDVTLEVEGTRPILVPSGFVDDRAGAPVAANVPVTYTVTFNKDMDHTTVDATDFGNYEFAPVTIGAITEISPGVFTVVATATGTGDLRLQVNSGAVLKDTLGNSLDTNFEIADNTTIIVDDTDPTLAEADILDDRDAAPVAPGTPVIYSFVFSEGMDVSTIVSSVFANDGTAPITIGDIAAVSPNVISVEITPTGAGTLRLKINASSVIRDKAGNPLDTTFDILDDETITVGGLAPTLASSDIVDDRGGLPVKPSTLVIYTVTFSTDMDGATVDASDFENAGTSPVSFGAISEDSPGVFTVRVTPTAVGTLILRVKAGAVLKDAGGIDMDTTSPVADDTTITVESTPPTLAGTDIVDDKSGGTVAANVPVTYTVTFSEDMDASTVTGADFGNAGTAPVSIGTATETAPTSGVFTVLATPTGTGSLRLRVNASAILKDAAGNNLNTASAILDDTTITVDGAAPTLAAADIVDDKGGAPITPNTLVTYTVTFSKDMDDATVDGADFGNAGTSPVTIGTVTETAPTSGVFIVQATPTGNGTLRLRLNASAVLTDALGNPVNTTSAVADNTIIAVDGTAPTLAGADIVDDQAGGPIAPNTLVTYTVTFSEDMDGSTVSSADFGNAGSSPVTFGTVTETSPGVFAVQATPTASGTLQLRVNASATLKDLAGNDLDTGSAILDDTTITVSAPADPFAAWSGGAAFDVDTNGDGMDNGLAWVLGAADANANANALVPTVDSTSDPAYLIFTFRRADEANGDPNTTIVVEYGTALTALGWTTAVHDNNDVIITETDNHYSTTPGIDRVAVKLKRSTLGSGGKLFTRLRVVQAP